MEGFPISVDMVPKKGRGVVATRALPKGSVLYVDVPYVSQVLFENKVKIGGGRGVVETLNLHKKDWKTETKKNSILYLT
jgi:hypothetical protein